MKDQSDRQIYTNNHINGSFKVNFHVLWRKLPEVIGKKTTIQNVLNIAEVQTELILDLIGEKSCKSNQTKVIV